MHPIRADVSHCAKGDHNPDRLLFAFHLASAGHLLGAGVGACRCQVLLIESPIASNTSVWACARQAIAMAAENEDYDLLEDVGEEVDYDDYTLEDEDLGKCFRLMVGHDIFRAPPSLSQIE